MNILCMASEVDPFAKTGGLADVAAALPKALAALGHDIRIVLPLYRQIDRKKFGLKSTPVGLEIRVGARTRAVKIWEAVLPKTRVPVYFVESPESFDREGLYQVQGKDHPDNLERFSLFSQAALRMLPALNWRPDVVHCHDWQAALASAQLTLGSIGREEFFTGMATAFTVHNLAYQGLFPADQWPITELPPSAFTIDGLEFYGQINCLKGGLVSSAVLTTVSPTYAKEIQTQEFGCGLEGVLHARSSDLLGILNGIDPDEWNPQTDPHIEAHYSAENPSGKGACKLALQRRSKLAERQDFLIGMIQRLADQKGIDIFAEALETLMGLPLQVVLLGTGDPKYHQLLEQLVKRFPDRLAVHLAFDNALAHQIEAGADAFLMPSKFEPCGLNQMYSMRFGTVPIVKRVGGLADTVTDLTPSTLAAKSANGFVFQDHTARALIETIKRALTAYGERALWTQLMHTGMRQDLSWTRSARAYVELYERARTKTAQGSRL
ncbi:MAG: glycogen synthase GlgA [Candidatus Omnitrophica bacterium CG11_big_fil_rev_8_21_14_0_20_63_9]|nr:MAG: glycogen synthase GlgA [Candidatus Omnitrophica bacterium CG11_big_fil_rev_8_21_14_0_20_63_9]